MLVRSSYAVTSGILFSDILRIFLFFSKHLLENYYKFPQLKIKNTSKLHSKLTYFIQKNKF